MMTEYFFVEFLINLRTKNKQTIISVDRRKSSSTFAVFLFIFLTDTALFAQRKIQFFPRTFSTQTIVFEEAFEIHKIMTPWDQRTEPPINTTSCATSKIILPNNYETVIGFFKCFKLKKQFEVRPAKTWRCQTGN